jgi:CRISPR/Cas system-associated endonuclease Cas1
MSMSTLQMTQAALAALFDHGWLLHLVADWLQRLDNWLEGAHLKEREAYLAQAQNLADLERRLHDLERPGQAF